jgi:hypothetical protein
MWISVVYAGWILKIMMILLLLLVILNISFTPNASRIGLKLEKILALSAENLSGNYHDKLYNSMFFYSKGNNRMVH